ncbi:MAG: redox-sensitive transcriptional activator SoxR [Paracoccaceae bacterium]
MVEIKRKTTRAEALLPIGVVADRTGLAVSAIRFYEAQGLVFPIRAASGHRQYRRSDIRRLSFVRIAQSLGFAIAEIRGELDRLPKERAPNKADWQRIARHFGAELDRRIAGMTDLRERLDGCIGCGCLSLRACALWNPDDSARATGPGPRYLLGEAPDAAG